MFDQAEYARLHEPAIQAICADHADCDPEDFVLAWSKRRDLPVRAMAELIDARQRARRKLPGWPVQDMLLDRIGVEQCSSLACATHRARMHSAETVLDCCGGLGIDSAAFARAGARVLHCEIDPLRQELARHNHAVLGMAERVTYHHGDGIARAGSGHWDLIYCDPARRDAQGRRAVDMRHLQPSPLAVDTHLRPCADRLLYKLAPATDRTAIGQAFGEDHAIAYLSLEGECKECLVATGAGAGERAAIGLTPTGACAWSLRAPTARTGSAPERDARAGDILLQADPAIIQAGVVDHLASTRGWYVYAARHGLLVTGGEAPSGPVRCARVLAVTSCAATAIRAAMRAQHISAARVTDRGAGIHCQRLQDQLRMPAADSHQVLCLRRAGKRRVALLLALNPG
ncbi:MAG: hypothetical protein ACOCXJ_07115 [Planctomycetota bacterium]